MRVYEFSKEIGISAKELVALLQGNGFDVKTHMSALTSEAAEFLRNKYKKKSEGSSEKVSKGSEEKVSIKSANIEVPAPDRAHEIREVMQNETVSRSQKQVEPRHLEKKSDKTGRQAPRQTAAGAYHARVARDRGAAPEIKAPESIIVTSMSVAECAEKLGKTVNDVILSLLKWGVVAGRNQVVEEATVARLADLYEIKKESKSDATAQKELVRLSADGDLQERLPVVVIVGHVDHGKTTLLDYIRKTRVASREKGGITQHIGAYEATTRQGSLVFIDTPGHEAFSKIRQRGVRVADIAVLIVAADDGVMPQTIEAIERIKEMKVPVVAAINKVDKVSPERLETIKRQLAQHDLLPDEWGGDVQCLPISAKTGAGIDHFLEMLVLQAQLMELRADVIGAGRGYVLESQVEKGRGAVATVICQHGKVSLGDYFTCGNTVGRVSSLVNSAGERILNAGPSIPVRIAGFEDFANVGDLFQVVDKETYQQARAARQKQQSFAMNQSIKEGSINIVIKTDTNSSQEALVDAIKKFSKKAEVGFNILYAGVGAVSEGDVELAFNTDAQIVCLHTRAEANAISLAQNRGVSITIHHIIYKLMEDLQERANKLKKVVLVRKKVGDAEVLKVFDIKNIGVIAGCQVKDGRFTRDGIAIILRKGQKIGEGKIASLQRDKKTVKEVHAGFECGFLVKGFSEFMPGDVVECYMEQPA